MKKKYNYFIIVKWKAAYIKHNAYMRFYDNVNEKNSLEKLVRRTVKRPQWQGQYCYIILKNKAGKFIKGWDSKGNEYNRISWVKKKKEVKYRAYIVFKANFANQRLSLGLPRNLTIPLIGESDGAEAVIAARHFVKNWKYRQHVHNIKIFEHPSNENVAEIIGDYYLTLEAHWSIMRSVRKLESLNQNI